jgi:DMSO reductase anchor subunit
MSREVIVLPAFMAAVAFWWWRLGDGPSPFAAVLAILLSAALWYCTAMIYACLRFVQEWAHPLTIVNYTLIGLSSGLVLAGALAVLAGHADFARMLAPWALLATVAAAGTRVMSLVRNAKLKPKSTLQSATGIQLPQLRQAAMGLTGGSFNTREFFHRATLAGMKQVRSGFLVFGFAVPALLLLPALSGAAWPWALALPIQFAGLVMERWFFFAQARHPQNLYYQVVS